MELWQEILSRLLDWRAPLEILLITTGLYFLYRSLTAMGAWKIVAGILVGLGVFAASRILDLKGIEWILSHFSGVALIALIVLFQPELRRIFERAASFRRALGRGDRPGLAGLLAEALFDLADRGWGAIVVLPGRESLASRVSSGTAVDGTPSLALLTSIFDPGSPGHDGAVVVDQERLVSFGVRLPLSRGAGLSESYGTRHHAALGLSEVTDALVLVVSEERQKVSAFQGGKVSRMEDREGIVRRVNEHWERVAGAAEASGRQWRRRVASAPLLGSFVVATLFWLSIVPQKGERLEMAFPVRVEYTAAPPRLSVVGNRIDEARIRVSGIGADLSRIDPSNLRVRADLSAVEPGRQLIPLTLAPSALPRNVQLIDTEPPALELEALPLVERELRVRAQLIGSPPQGLEVEVVDIRPDSVSVLAPETTDVPEEILTGPIHLRDVAGPTRILSRVVVPPGLRPARGDWPEVVVNLEVVRSRKG
jgi:uncharacterized protein (TIGR00159 family)